MSSITTGIIMINVLGEIEFVNHSAKKIFEIDQEEVMNNHYYMVFQNNPNLVSLLENSELKDEIVYEDNFKIQDTKESPHEINLTLSPVYNEDNERSGTVFSFEDLSGINKIKSTFKKYVSENIVDELLQNENALELGGAQSEVCVLFSDIRGFTALSEKMKPSEVVYLLNTYFEAMIDVVFAHNGTLDKIIGDELMVLYGVPLKNKNDSQSAVNSALSMFKALEKFNNQMEKENLPKLEIGIGVNFGKVVSGNIGSERQMNYTVIGDAVNLASRLCSHAKSGEVLISKSVFERLEVNKGFISQTPIMVKGKSQEIENWIYNAI
jgi:adenylate cyclase